MKKTVLITGASSGIGYELTKRFAQDGYDLVLVARDRQRLEQLASELAKQYSVSTKVMPQDLAKATAPDEIFTELQRASIQVDILVNNAGFNVYGPFVEADLPKTLQMIQVNLTALTHLTRLLLPDMVKRRNGRILNVGSTGSFAPGPLNAVYCATKAYVLSFSEAIAEELQGTGVTVTALCPGATKTEFAKRASMEDANIFLTGAMKAQKVAEIGYRALMQGKRTVITGLYNKFQIFSTRFAPRVLVAKIAKLLMSRRHVS
jgi:short-subunit dehydrogenase